MTRAELAQKCGHVEADKWPEEKFWCVKYYPPAALKWINSLTGKPVLSIYCHKEMRKPLDAALKNVLYRGLSKELKTFDGCFEIRKVRGSDCKPSFHSWARAIDINAKTNQLGREPTLSPELVKCFKDASFFWGGDFSRKDGMHFQIDEE